ncbi:GTPase involved in ribosome synthesis and maintenance [Candidatus Terasakiella magnetica]|uniref:GTPase Der n=1 Tax=Candidatus Terasakiella magnetica TaxID=1867952 RepID=A0A1C3RL71_9PROT|nr:ribosome biogenesis GTPase Der [Candidatus Terasakiella magnetica]SCA57919.1 GTPase involved in ribosome synthesis and maintenance [Candidatus Terasakiella magnetica]
MPFTVAIVGRPNVGKSTLFNRLVGKKLAIVDDTPGVTRDRREGTGRIGDLDFKVIDTAGLEEAFDDSLEARMREQTELALDEADMTLFMIDARAGVTPLDEHFADWLRERNKDVVLLANKCEGNKADNGIYEAYGLGLGDPYPFSAEHGVGMSNVYDALQPAYDKWCEDNAELLEEEKLLAQVQTRTIITEDGEEIEEQDFSKSPLQVAIVGRPNVGKSTLINQLLGTERLLTGPEAGITRDSIALDYEVDGRKIKLIDTAGMRRRTKVNEKVETLSAADSRRAIRFAQIVCLVLDSNVMLEKQDLVIAKETIDEGRALVIVCNKWDDVKNRKEVLQKLSDRMETSMPQVRGIPVITLSAKTGKGTDRLFPAIFDLYESWNARVPTGQLNRWLEQMTEMHPPPLSSGRRLRLRYMTQAKTRPPTFVIFANKPGDLPGSYLRYLSNSIREDFDIQGVPIRVMLRKGDNPYEHKKKKR